jgi:hypothetical protein
MGKRRFLKAFLLLAGFCLAVLGPMPLGAQTLERWFSKPAVSESYESIKAEIMAAAEELRRLSLSEDLLLSRLEEAATKNVSATALLAGISADMDYVRTILEDFKTRNLLLAKEKDAAKAMQNALLIVRAGIEEKELERALDLASSQGELKGRQSAILSRAFAALGVTASAKAVYGLSESSRAILAEYLITSQLTERKFDSVIAEIAERIKKGETAELAVSSLGNNGNAAGKPDNSAPGREKSKGSERPGKETSSGNGQGSNSSQNDSPSTGAGFGLKPAAGKKGN